MALPDDHRRPISMALYGGASYRQVASGLGIAETEARARMRSGLQQVRRELDSGDPGEGMVIEIPSPGSPVGEQPWSPLPAA